MVAFTLTPVAPYCIEVGGETKLRLSDVDWPMLNV
jgi:hypothetical protein